MVPKGPELPSLSVVGLFGNFKPESILVFVASFFRHVINYSVQLIYTAFNLEKSGLDII